VPGERDLTAPRRATRVRNSRESDGVVSACFAMVPPARLLFAQVDAYAWQEDD
jgi:hypothetical protein